jgi:hypothetical protein
MAKPAPLDRQRASDLLSHGSSSPRRMIHCWVCRGLGVHRVRERIGHRIRSRLAVSIPTVAATT